MQHWKDSSEAAKHDHLAIRCPRLGGEVTFAYCRIEGGDLPCARIIPCWENFLPIGPYISSNLLPEAVARFAALRPKGKVASLIELIEAAKEGNR